MDTSTAETSSDAGQPPNPEKIAGAITTGGWYSILDEDVLDGNSDVHRVGAFSLMTLNRSDTGTTGRARLSIGTMPINFHWELVTVPDGNEQKVRLDLSRPSQPQDPCKNSNYKWICGWASITSGPYIVENVDEIRLFPEPHNDPQTLKGKVLLEADSAEIDEFPWGFGRLDGADFQPADLKGTWVNHTGDEQSTIEVFYMGTTWRATGTTARGTYNGELKTLSLGVFDYWGVEDRGEPLFGGVIESQDDDIQSLIHPGSDGEMEFRCPDCGD